MLSLSKTIAALVVGIIAATSIPGCILRKTAEDAESNKCRGCQTCIVTAMHQYHEKYGHLPPAYVLGKDGRPAHSWRVLLLEFLDPPTFQAYRFDESWNSENNRKLESKMPSCYRCPSHDEARENWHTSYFVVVGEGTAFPGSQTVKFDDIRRPKGETILLIENIDEKIHWMAPNDLMFATMSFSINDPKQPSVSSNHRNGPIVCMADLTVRQIEVIRPDELRTLFLLATPEK